MSNNIGNKMKMLIKNLNISRKTLAKRLGYEYADNDRMICFRLGREDRLWSEVEVEAWCNAMGVATNGKLCVEMKKMSGRKF